MFSSGNDISVFMEGDTENMETLLHDACIIGVRDFIGSILNSKKPTVFMVRGRCLGMTFTI